jgi:hypothetical protein
VSGTQTEGKGIMENKTDCAKMLELRLGFGLDEDGMCHEHGVFGCARCIATFKRFLVFLPPDVADAICKAEES